MVVVAAVDDFAQLILEGGYQIWVVMSQSVDGNAAQCVQINLAIHIPQAATLTVAHGDGQSAISVHGVRGCGFNEFRHTDSSGQKNWPNERAAECRF